VKFQTFTARSLVSEAAPKAGYQIASTGAGESQLSMLERLEMPRELHLDLASHARDRGVEFLSTPFDGASLEFLVSEVGIRRIKIPSGELVNGPLLHRAAGTSLPMVVSTGMADMDEIATALDIIAQGRTAPDSEPAVDRPDDLRAEARRSLADHVCLLHCTTEYPAPLDDVHLAAMDAMREAFGLPVGYSDHTTGIAVSIAAAARGAAVIEKHFTLDRERPGPDHHASLEPDELAELVDAVRAAQRAVGGAAKRPSATEIGNRIPIRQSLAALADIAPGEAFTVANLGTRRPGDGLPPNDYWALLGTPADRPYRAGEIIRG